MYQLGAGQRDSLPWEGREGFSNYAKRVNASLPSHTVIHPPGRE